MEKCGGLTWYVIRSFTPRLPFSKRPQGFQEAVVWKHAKHPNIVPFLGITSAPLQLVSIRMSGGDLMEYAKKYPRADRLALVSFFLLRDENFSPPC